MKISRLALLALLSCGSANAGDYSDEQHESIWKARLQAAQQADVEAAEACGWRPEEPLTFADDIRQEDGIREPELFLMISRMIREDQNALAVYNSVHDGVCAEDAAEALGRINAANLAIMKRHFEEDGFPGVADIGNNGINALLLLVAHADADPDFQSDVLEMMKNGVMEGNLPEYIPSVLESLRPRVNGLASNSDETSSSSRSVRGPESPRQCFYGTRSKLIRSFLRDRFRTPDQA